MEPGGGPGGIIPATEVHGFNKQVAQRATIAHLRFNKYSHWTKDQRTIGPENAHLKPDLGVLSHHEMTLNTDTPLLTSQGVCICKVSGLRLHPVISEQTIISILIFK